MKKIYLLSLLSILIFVFQLAFVTINAQNDFILKNQENLTFDFTINNQINPYTEINFGDSTYLDSIIVQIMEEHHVPGASTYIFRDNQILWNRSYGYADIKQNKKVTDSTTFITASISKVFTATALMQLWEDGLFELDDNINNYLPPELQVVNPDYPDDAITFRHLLTHTSSIAYDWPLTASLYCIGDCPTPLESFLIDYLMPGGKYYNRGPFISWAPGTKWEYGNEDIALLGYLVEVLSDTSFEDYCQQNIFIPLGMNETSFFLSGMDNNNIALPYYEYSGGEHRTDGHVGFPVYPPWGAILRPLRETQPN